ncbi:replication fork protection component Swi3-domain-containing protein [Entophlyctis helioformis]|nr:replication fork protection component Swi3-domain-containing protein [Entophlyctis helioformis]
MDELVMQAEAEFAFQQQQQHQQQQPAAPAGAGQGRQQGRTAWSGSSSSSMLPGRSPAQPSSRNASNSVRNPPLDSFNTSVSASQDPAAILPSSSGQQRASGSGTASTPRQPRIVAKLDAERLLGPSGLPTLLQRAKKLRLKGKGHELQDLNKVLMIYKIWGLELFPKLAFPDFVERLERVCRERRVRLYMAQLLRDQEMKELGIGADHSNSTDMVDLFGVESDDEPSNNADRTAATKATATAASGSSSPRRGDAGQSSQPATTTDDFDLDELFAIAAASAPAPASISIGIRHCATQDTQPKRRARAVIDTDSDDDDMAELRIIETAPATAPARSRPAQAHAPTQPAQPAQPQPAAATLAQDKLALIAANRERALAKLAAKQAARDQARKVAEREAEERRVAAMIAAAGPLFGPLD